MNQQEYRFRYLSRMGREVVKHSALANHTTMGDQLAIVMSEFIGDDDEPESQRRIREVCFEVCQLLLSKNKAYGNSALDPVRIFSKASAEEQINVRIDDKLSRLARGHAAGEDVELDLIGYLILKRVKRKDDSVRQGK